MTEGRCGTVVHWTLAWSVKKLPGQLWPDMRVDTVSAHFGIVAVSWPVYISGCRHRVR